MLPEYDFTGAVRGHSAGRFAQGYTVRVEKTDGSPETIIMLTRNLFNNMREDALRKEIIAPLLQAMGYNDVHIYHGGSGEKGKDVVCWKPDALGTRENLAIVAKAQPMNGQSKVDKGTAGEVQMQINQCFGSPYTDTISGQQESVHDVWVVSNHKITKEAKDAISAGVADTDKMRHVRFVEGDVLWGFVQKHLPLSVMAFAEELRKQTQDVDSHYQPHVTVSGDKTTITLHEKFPGASQEKPLSFSTKFTFDTPEEAEQFHAKFQNSLDTGEPLDIPAKNVAKVTIPEVLQKTLGVSELQVTSMQLFSGNSWQPKPVRIIFRPRKGKAVTLPFVLLRVVQAGEKEVTVASGNQDVPFQLKFKISWSDKELVFSIEENDSLYSAVQYLELLNLHTCLSGPFQITWETAEHGITIFDTSSKIGFCKAPDKHFVNLIRMVSVIQKKIKQPIFIPKRDITNEEVQHIHQIYEIVTTGRLEWQWSPMTATLKSNQHDLDLLIETFKDNKEAFMRQEGTETYTLFDVEIPLGPFTQDIHNIKIDNLEELISRYDELRADEITVNLRFVPGAGAIARQEYANWKPQ